jgi:hypothetical protein
MEADSLKQSAGGDRISRQAAEHAAARSALARAQSDFVDVLLAHGPNHAANVVSMFEVVTGGLDRVA